MVWSPQVPSHFLQVPWKTVVPVPRPLSRKNSLLLRRGWPFCSIQAVDRLDEAHSHYRGQSAYSVHKFTRYFHPNKSSEKYLELCWSTELWLSQADISKINPRTSPASSSFSLVAQMGKNLSAVQDTQVRSLGWEDPIEKDMATHSSVLAWRIPGTEEPGRLQSMELQRVGHD